MRDYRQAAPVHLLHKSRVAHITLDRGVLKVDGHCLLLHRESGVLEIPGSLVSAFFIEPGVSVTHEAVKLCADNKTKLFWVGEGLIRLYSACCPDLDASRVLAQARVHESSKLRIGAARRLYQLMFGEDFPPSYTIEKLRGIEGSKVRSLYQQIALEHRVQWKSREDAPADLKSAIGFATSCLYAISEVAIMAAGYVQCIGVVHSGNARSLVYDLADTIKFKTVVPLAFEVYKASPPNVNMAVRHACRDLFREKQIFEILLENLYSIMGEE